MINFMHAWAKSTRPYWNDLRRLGCPWADRALRAAYPLALSVLMRCGKGCVGVRSYLRPIRQLRSWPAARSDRPHIRQMDSLASRPREAFSPELLALPVRVRKRESGFRCQSGKWSIGLVRLHNRAICQETIDQARYGRQQAAYGLVHHAAALPKSKKQDFPQLWRPRHSSVRALEGFCSILGGYGADLSRRLDHRASGRKRPLRAGQLYLGSFIRAIKEQTPVFGMELQ